MNFNQIPKIKIFSGSVPLIRVGDFVSLSESMEGRHGYILFETDKYYEVVEITRIENFFRRYIKLRRGSNTDSIYSPYVKDLITQEVIKYGEYMFNKALLEQPMYS